MTSSTDTKTMMDFIASKKSMVVAYIFLFFLGIFGAHRFYLGKIKTAVTMLLLTIIALVTYYVGIGAILSGIVAIWWFVDLFLIPSMVKKYNLGLADKLSS